MSSENLFAQLTQLFELGSVPKSSCGRTFLEVVSPLLDGGVIVDERSVAGRRLVVRDAATFQAFIESRFPNSSVTIGTASRIEGLARFRNTKALSNDLPEIVCLRGWRDDVLKSRDEFVFVTQATQHHGLFSFLLRDPEAVSLHGSCALVENPAVFAVFEQLQLNVPLVIYGHGRFSNRALDWLARQNDPAFKLLHLPDYDPVGLCEFERLRERLGARVQLHVPNELPALFPRYANPELLLSPASQALLARLRNSQTLEVQQIVALIDANNGGLEQEVLLIPQS
jgi:hypothetical protein